MYVVILLFLIILLLFGSYLADWIDQDDLQVLGWVLTIAAGLATILQFVFPLATSFEAIEPTNTPPPIASPEPTSPPSVPEPAEGDPIISEIDDMTLLNVPEGDFPMGSADNDDEADSDEKPLHTVYLSAYWIDQTEVTNAMFAKFVNERGNQEEGGVTWLAEEDWALIEKVNGSYQSKDGYADHPVVAVSWYGAKAYCEWAGRRLPTEAEWEKAAGGTDGRKWPWGNDAPNGNLLNFCDQNCRFDWKIRAPMMAMSSPRPSATTPLVPRLTALWTWPGMSGSGCKILTTRTTMLLPPMRTP